MGIGTTIWADTKLNRVDALVNYGGRPSGGLGSNWLLVGSDSRVGLTPEQEQELNTGGDIGSARTDTIMIVHVPLVGKATMVSLPRDLYVDIPGYGKNKLNASFFFGGPQLLQQTVEQATGLHIDHYMEIGFGGLAGIVDALGGVNICVDQPMQDEFAGIDLQPGCQDMNGPTALGFVRSRHALADGDIGRERHQREFLNALVKKIASPGTLLNPFRFYSVMGKGLESVSVDKGDHVWNLGRLALALALGPKTEEVPIAGFEDAGAAGSVVVWDEQKAHELFDSLR